MSTTYAQDDSQTIRVDGKNNQGPLITASSFSDEGYYSCERSSQAPAESNSKNNEDRDDIESVLTDNRETGMSIETKIKFSTFFAKELIRSLDPPDQLSLTTLTTIVPSLPECLREFSLIIETRARSVLERRAVSFVRHRRK